VIFTQPFAAIAGQRASKLSSSDYFRFLLNLSRIKLNAVATSRHPASRRRSGASGWQELGASLSWYSRHSENGNGREGPNESDATTNPTATERITVINS